MKLVIAEKKELAEAIAQALGEEKYEGGVWRCAGDYVVAPARGHLLELVQPEDYDPRYKQWTRADLPWNPGDWRKQPTESSRQLYATIAKLLKSAHMVVHAGDPDHEGQLIVDEILEHERWRGPVKRALINDNNPGVIRKAFDGLEDNDKFKGMGAVAEARSRADQLYGVNVTRAYTLAAQQRGYQGVLHAGRVSLAILGLVVRRDLAHESHQAAYFYVPRALFNFGDTRLPCHYVTTEMDHRDDKGRLVDEDRALDVVRAVSNQAGRISKAHTKSIERPPPLPYNLLRLQADAARLYGYKPDKVMEVTQSLRDKHRAITYNRTDSQYLSDEHHSDAAEVLAAVAAVDAKLAPAVERADPAVKSRAFNSEKVTAHHGIIPTQARPAASALSADERNLYYLIARAYVAQFFPSELAEKTEVEIECEGCKFKGDGEVVVRPGWRVLYEADAADASADEPGSDALDLRELVLGQGGVCMAAESLRQATRAPARYTMAGLLEDLASAAKYVKNERLRQALQERDKAKESENGGIGTPATRDSLIKNLFDRGYFEEFTKGKISYVLSTARAREYYHLLPDQAKYPDMTAIWAEQLRAVESGDLSVAAFVGFVADYVTREIDRVDRDGIAVRGQLFPCSKCGAAMRRITNAKSPFWACSAGEACGHTMNDFKGAPVDRPQASELHKCLQCARGLVRRQGGRGYFWSCSGFKDGCKQSYPDFKGTPNYASRKAAA